MPYTFFCPRLHTHSSHNPLLQFSFFFFNDTATTEIYTLSLHDAFRSDRKSTRLNSSHDQISYAVFCLKKKNELHDPDVSVPSATAARSTCPRVPHPGESDVVTNSVG